MLSSRACPDAREGLRCASRLSGPYDLVNRGRHVFAVVQDVHKKVPSEMCPCSSFESWKHANIFSWGAFIKETAFSDALGRLNPTCTVSLCSWDPSPEITP